MARWLPEGVAAGPFGIPVVPRIVVASTVAAALTLLLGVLALVSGSSTATVSDVVHVLVGQGDVRTQLIVLDIRMPRVAGALLVGWCLGLAGALTQTMSRNPLATPDILGVTAGASLGAVTAIVLGGGAQAVGSSLLGLGIPALAIISGLTTSAVIYLLGLREGVTTYRFILIGIGATAILGGLTSYLLFSAQITQAAAAAQWLVGSLSGVSWGSVQPLAVAAVLVTAAASLLGRGLDLSLLGEDLAQGMGLEVQRHRLVVIAVAAVLASAAVAAAGPVGFVAFVSPQIAVRAARARRPPLALSAMVGAIVTVAADGAGRALFTWDIPVGIFTAVIGSPYLIWLLVRQRKNSEAV